MRWPLVGRRERLRREASDWIARLNGAQDQADRAAFERWYRANPEHAATYDRLSALFATAGEIRAASKPVAVRHSAGAPAHGLRTRYALAAVAAAGVIAIILGYAVLGAMEVVPSGQNGVQVMVLAAGDESRLVHLADGSEIVLAPASTLNVDINGRERRLQLLRGEGRFKVFHEARPFVVVAQGTQVVARGTEFVVSLRPDGTLVSLIDGRVDVSYASLRDGGERRIASLEPGQRLLVSVAPVTLPLSESTVAGPSRPAMVEFDDTPLAEAVERVDLQAGGRIRLADPTLEHLRVTGAFRVGDIEEFAEGVAAALDLEVERRRDGTLWLRERSDPGG